MLYHLTPVSTNVKTGHIPVSTSTAETCPKACPLAANGCYANGGPLAIHWRKITNGERGDTIDVFAAKISKLNKGQLWRHNQAGDLPSKDKVNIDAENLIKIVRANNGKKGFTYTHYNPFAGHNGELISYANGQGFTINLSANNLAHVDVLKSSNSGPVVTVLSQSYERKNKKGQWLETMVEYRERLKSLPMETPEGHKIAVCPATFSDDITCANCGICAIANRKTVIGFPAHGVQSKAIDKIA